MSIVHLLYNPQERRLRSLLRLAIQTGLYYVVNIVLYLILAGLFVFLAPGLDNDVDAESLADTLSTSPGFLLTATLITGLVVLLSTWLAAGFLDHRPVADFGLGLDRTWWADLLFGLLLGGALMAGIFGVQLGAGWIRVTEVMGMAGQPVLWGKLMGPLALYVTVGIYEEVLFRGYRMRNLAEGFRLEAMHPRWALAAAWVVSSVWFGLAHRHNPNATVISNINLALAGLFLGLGYLLSGRLGLPIGLHIAWNFFQGNVFGFPVSGTRVFPATVIAVEQGGPVLWTGGAFGPEAGLVGIIAMMVGCLAILAWVRLRQGRISLHLPLTRYAPSPSRPWQTGQAQENGVGT